MKRFRYDKLPREEQPNAWVKCEICGNETHVSVLYCMQEGWPECCEVGGSPQTMALLVDDKTKDIVKASVKVMSRTRPITGLMNGPLFYEGPRQLTGVNIPRKNVKG